MKSIAILAPEQQVYVRSVLKGVLKFALSEPEWLVSRISRLEELEYSPCEGLIAFLPRKADQERVRELPVVNFSGSLHVPELPTVMPDSRKIGHMAAEHLLERGYRQFLYVGTGSSAYSAERSAGFVDTLRVRGVSQEVIRVNRVTDLQQSFEQIPLPVGVFCATDSRAGQVAQLCRAMGLGIPQDVGLVGCDNDELGYLRAGVPLTSVDPNGERVGWEAGEMLKTLLAEKNTVTFLQIPPIGLEDRQSTNLLQTEDPLIAQTMERIRTLACSGVKIDEIICTVPLYRSALEPRFKKVTGRTLLQEIKRTRLEAARRSLRETQRKVTEIIADCGYTCPTRFHKEFKQLTRMTPREYRKSVGGGG